VQPTPSPTTIGADRVRASRESASAADESPAPELGPLDDLLQSDAVTPATYDVLAARLAALDEPWPDRGAFFSVKELATLRAVVNRLVPEDHRAKPLDVAILIDRRLAGGRSDGWRPDALPNDGESYRLALRGFDEFANERHHLRFVELNGLQQDALIVHVQRGRALGPAWEALDPATLFTELLAEATQIYFSDPIAQIEIGYVGFADQPGWEEVGLNQRDPREPAVPSRGQRMMRRPE